MTADAPGVVPREDPTYDDRDESPTPATTSPTAGRSEASGAPGATGGGRSHPPLDGRDRWILDQRPPHWG